jgi:hypothetical protein
MDADDDDFDASELSELLTEFFTRRPKARLAG